MTLENDPNSTIREIEDRRHGSLAEEKKSSSIWPVFFIFFILSCGFFFLPKMCGNGTSEALHGKPAPSFSASYISNEATSGDTFHLHDQKGKLVILDFWATWCGPCIKEAPVLERLWHKYKDRDVLFVGVNTDDEPELAKAFAKQFKLSYPIVHDTNNSASRLYGITSLPTLVFVAKDGSIKTTRIGEISEARLSKLIETLL